MSHHVEVEGEADLEDGRLSLAAERLHVFSTSSLGFVAAHYARACSDRVLSLILASSPLSLRDLEAQQSSHWQSNATPERKAQLAENLGRIRPEGQRGSKRRLAMAGAYAPMSWFNYHFDPAPLVSSVDANQEEEFRSSAIPVIAALDLLSVLRELSCPLLHIHGLHDFTAPLPPWEDIEFPGATRVILERSAHHPWYEESETFSRELVAWVASRPAA